ATTMPLVFQAFNWVHGVYLGANLGSETTAAAEGAVGRIRHDTFAMLPFCGYNMGDYFAHWLEMRKRIPELPRIFHVNWFREGADGAYLWPGFRENMRVLEWIFDRIRGQGRGHESCLGWVPRHGELTFTGLDFSEAQFAELMRVNPEEIRQELLSQYQLYLRLYDTLP